MPIEKPLGNYKLYPKMVHWFSPSLLFKLLGNVITSSIFGKYADRRLIVAALDTVTPEEHIRRATAIRSELQPVDGTVSFDFVADLGDGFDSTFAVASLLAQKDLTVGSTVLPRGQALIFGGDEVYPAASQQAYRNQLWQPYNWAFPDHDKKSNDGIPVFAIPGNHDWYDGLVLFLANFCREKPFHLGSWRSRQRRSYFAFQITDSWWLWATDIQLADDMDQPQADYFKVIAARMPENSKIILCSAEPGWLYTDTNSKSWSITDYAIGIVAAADRGLTIPVLISGDTHHYSRYVAEDGTQFITSGGGGAFLHPTHHLEENIELNWMNGKKRLSLPKVGTASENGEAAYSCYPSMDVSRRLTWGNLWFAVTNWDFSILMAAIYWVVGIAVSSRNQWDVYIIVALIFGWAIIGYTTNQEKTQAFGYEEKEDASDREKAEQGRKKKRGWIVLSSSVIHSAAHVTAVMFFASFFADYNVAHPLFAGNWYSGWVWIAVLFAQMGIAGFVVGSTIFGLNLLVTCRWLRMNRNDAFSSLRLGRFNNFLRLQIRNEKLEIHVVGLDDVPDRDGWKGNPTPNPLVHGKRDQTVPIFVPRTALAPKLVETFKVEPKAVQP
jgi:hypothetical protein